MNMTLKLLPYSNHDPLTRFVTDWQRFWRLYRLWWRMDDLEQLMRWAARKGIKQRDYYEHLWLETHTRIIRSQLRSPQLGTWAYRWYQCVSLFAPTLHYHTKGSAQTYRRSQYRMQVA